MTRVVFNPFTKAHLVEHFQIKERALLQTLRFNEFAFREEQFLSLTKFGFDRVHRANDLIARRDVVARRIDHKARDFLHDDAR